VSLDLNSLAFKIAFEKLISFALPGNAVDTADMTHELQPPTQPAHNTVHNRKNKIEDVLNPMRWLRNRCLPLFIALVVLLWAYPFMVTEDTHATIWGLAVFTLLPAIGVVSLAGVTGIVITFAALSIFIYGAYSINHLEMSNALIGWPGLFVVIYYAYSTILVGFAVFRKEAVQPDRIYGGISVYLLIGIVFSVIHHRISEQDLGAYQSTMNGALPTQAFAWHDLLYFSFSTLTTIGYGDLVPMSARARSTALLEGIIGVLYPAILIAKLVNWPTGNSTETRPLNSN
jgi:hypothetical protein